MIVHISATLRAGKLIKGNHEWPVSMGFQGNTDIHSFYLHLQQDNVLLNDILQDILDSDDTDIMPNCTLDDMGIFYVDKPENEQSMEQLINKIDTSTGTAIIQLLHDNPFTNSKNVHHDYICMWMSASLCNLKVLDGLLKIGYSGGNRLIILALLYKGENNFLQKGFYAKLPGIYLLNLFYFQNVKLKYLIASPNSKILKIEGGLSIKLQEHTLDFFGDIVMDNDGYDAELGTVGKCDVLEPFTGIVDSLIFQQIIFHIRHTYQDNNSEYFLKGSVILAGVHTTGQIYFQGNELHLAVVTLNTDFSLAKLWSHFFPHYAWNENDFNIIFLAGSELYYCSPKGKDTGYRVSDKYYEQGCVITLSTELTLINTLALEGKLYIKENCISASLSSKTAIDLSILKIEGITKNGIQNSGPELAFSLLKNENGRNSQIEINGKIILFQKEITEGEIQYIKDKTSWEIRANLTLPDSLKNIFIRKFTLVYSSLNGFHIETKDEFLFSNEALNFVKILNDFTDKARNKCNAITIDRDDKINLKFHLQPKICGSFCTHTRSGEITATNTNGWEITLGLCGSVDIMGKDGQILVQRTFGSTGNKTINNETSFDDFPDLFIDILTNTLNSVIDALFEDDSFDDMKKILLYLLGSKVLEYADDFICRRLMDETKRTKLSHDVCSSNSLGGGTALGASLFAAAGGSAFDGGELFAALAAGFAGILLMILIQTTKTDDSEEEKKLNIPEFKGMVEGASLTVSIEEIKNAIGYEIDIIWITDKRRDKFITYKPSENPHELSLLDIPVYGNVYIAIRAIHAKQELSSDWSEANLLTDISASMLITWAKNSGYCLQCCRNMLINHGVIINNIINKLLIQTYAILITPTEIAQKHFNENDTVEHCLEHLKNAYPRITQEELLLITEKVGYKENVKNTMLEMGIWLE